MALNQNNSRLPAEWESHAFTQLTWPSLNTDWNYMLPEAVNCFCRILDAIATFEPVLIVTDSIQWLRSCLGTRSFKHDVWAFECPINDTWTRDHGLITLLRPDGNVDMLDFTFNGWGLKFAANHDNQINTRLASGPLAHNSIFHMSTVLEGGSIESDGCGALMSSSMCLLAPNRNGFQSISDAISDLAPIFRPQRFHFVESGELIGDDTDGHIDTIARFAPQNTILYLATDDSSDPHYDSLRNMLADLRTFSNANGEAYRLCPLPLCPPIFDPESGERLPATYANFYFVNGAILVPTYGVSTDDVALRTLSDLYAHMGYEIIGVDCLALIRQHGSLHCSTMQFPAPVKFDTSKLTKL